MVMDMAIDMDMEYVRGITILPPELINLILSFLDYRDVGACYVASSLFHVLTPEHKMWLKYHTKHAGTLIRKGDLIGLQYQLEKLKRKEILSITNIKSAVQFDHSHILEFMLDKNAAKGSEHIILGTALQWNRYNLCKLLYYKYPSIIHPNLINGYGGVGVGIGQIVDADSTEILAWLHFIGVKFSAQVQEHFSKRYFGLQKLQWLTAIGVDLCPLTSAARAGRFETVRWMFEKGAPHQELAANLAAGEGHYMTAKFLYLNNTMKTHWSTYPFSESTGSMVNIELCKFLHFTAAPGDPLITALCSGDLTMIQFFCTLGYPILNNALNAAASVGPYTSIQYVHLVHPDKLPVYPTGEMNPLDCATIYGRKSILRFLLRTELYRPRFETLAFVADLDDTQLMDLLISGPD